MKIIPTKTIKEYLKRIEDNINANYQNDYLDGYVDPKDEKLAKKELLNAGELDLKDDTSLYISTKEFLNNPYMVNVVNNILNNNDFNYEEITFKKNLLFNYDALIDDPDKELKDYMALRALDEDLDTIILKEDDVEWMMASPSESKTNDPYALKAHGKVITFGLGIGYFLYKALLNEKVKEVTVVEKSESVINMFNKIIKYFPSRVPIKIINGDAFDYFNKDFLDEYDYIYVDIYQNETDGLTIMEKLLSLYNPELNKCDFWIESSITSILKTLIYLVYKELVTNKKMVVKKEYEPLFNKCRNYFKEKDIVIDDENVLKEMMYDHYLLRCILAFKESNK